MPKPRYDTGFIGSLPLPRCPVQSSQPSRPSAYAMAGISSDYSIPRSARVQVMERPSGARQAGQTTRS